MGVSYLKPKGKLIIDHRNFEYILQNKNLILANPKNNYKYLGAVNYCGKKVIAYPVKISQEQVTFEYLHKLSKQIAHLTHYTFFEDDLRKELLKIGFTNHRVFYDHQKQKPNHYDFVFHVVDKII